MGCSLHKFIEVIFGIIPGRRPTRPVRIFKRHAVAHVKHEYEMRRTYLFYLFVVSYHESRILPIESIFCNFEIGNFFVHDFIQLVYTLLTFQLFFLIGILFLFKLYRQFDESLIYLVIFFFVFIKLVDGVLKVTVKICLIHLEFLKLNLLQHCFSLFFIQLCFLT